MHSLSIANGQDTQVHPSGHQHHLAGTIRGAESAQLLRQSWRYAAAHHHWRPVALPHNGESRQIQCHGSPFPRPRGKGRGHHAKLRLI